MSHRVARYLAWSLWATVMGLVVVVALVEVMVPYFRQFLPSDLTMVIVLVAMATTGVVVAPRNPGTAIGWLLLFFPVVSMVAGGLEGYTLYTIHVRAEAVLSGVLVGLLASALWAATLSQLAFLILLFPTGTLLSARWRRVSWGVVGTLAVLVISSSLIPGLGLLEIEAPLKNPIAIDGAEGILGTIVAAALVVSALLFIVAIASLVLR